MNNNDSLKYPQLLSVCYELEGLLLLAINREESLPEDVKRLMSQKAATLSLSLNQTPANGSEYSPVDEIKIGEDAVADDEVAEAAEEEEIADADTDAVSPQEVVAVPAVVDQEPCTTKSPTLIFAIGDKFRFKRELFNNSESEFTETVSAISSMDTLDEIEDYLFNDLCFDPQNETVRDFIKIISTNRF